MRYDETAGRTEGEGASVETWRCPTCLTVLAHTDAKRCPSCHSKLRRRRGQPIVLGETSRLDQQAARLVEKRNQQRGERPYEYSPPAAPPPVEPEPEVVAIVVETPAPERAESIVFEPAPVEPEPFAPEPFEAGDYHAAIFQHFITQLPLRVGEPACILASCVQGRPDTAGEQGTHWES